MAPVLWVGWVLMESLFTDYSVNSSAAPGPVVAMSWSAVTIGALIIGIGFWGPLYYDYNKEPPK